MLRDVLVVAGGAAAVAALAELVVRHALRLAGHLRLTGSLVGLTLLSVGTSVPEIVTHVVGSARILDDPSRRETLSGLLVGANVGSDLVQQGFVLPLVGLVGSLVIVRRNLVAEVGGLMAAAALLLAACADGEIARWEGGLLLLAYAGYLVFLWRRRIEPEGDEPEARRLSARGVATSCALVVAGFAAMAWVANAVLDSASELVERLPISASLFGVVVLGLASALPELTTALVSMGKGRREVSSGILIGSNITNPLCALALGAVMSGYGVPRATVLLDLPVKIGSGALLLVFLWTKKELDRREAVVLMVVFAAYLVVRRWLFPEDASW